MVKRTLDEIKARAEEFADAFEEYEPQVEHFNAQLSGRFQERLIAWQNQRNNKDDNPKEIG